MQRPPSPATLVPLIALCAALSLAACSRKDAGTASDPTTAAFNGGESATSAEVNATQNATTAETNGVGAADAGNAAGVGDTTAANNTTGAAPGGATP
jgi:hypothetical protein